MSARPAAGGGRWVEVAPERLAGWIDRFAERHGAIESSGTPEVVTVVASDGSVAELQVPFPPLPQSPALAQSSSQPPGDTADPVAGIIAHARKDRVVGVLLVRRGGHAAGVFQGGRLVASKVGSRHVQGRSAAGGWSQQRFARRRAGQATVAMSAAADVAAGLLVPYVGRLDGVVLGGDRTSVAAVLEDPRLARLRSLPRGPHLDVPDPRLAVLERAAQQFRAVRIRVVDPDDGGQAAG
jgi:Actinobacteria/chloroflexi VLRF1 release factor